MSIRRAMKRRIRGLLLMGASLLLSVVYLRLPIWRKVWSQAGVALFWSLLGLMFVLGLWHLTISLLPKIQRRDLSMVRRHRVLIPREGLVYLVIMVVLFIGSLLGHANMLMLVFAMLAGPFVINGWSAFAMLNRSQLNRVFPPRVMCGELFSVELTLRNTGALMSLWMMQVRDIVTGCGETLGPTILFTCVPPRGEQVSHYSLRLRRRGAYSLGPLHVSSRFPLGLIERGKMFPVANQILVYPRVGRLTRRAQRQLLGSAEITSARRARMGIFHDEFHHLREYRPGDNPRAIHWRTSARRGSLILREYEQNREQQLTVIVDLWQPASAVSAEDRERTEWALCLATSLCLAQRQQSREAKLALYVSGQTTVSWEGRATAASLESLLDQLATIQAGTAADTSQLLQQCGQGGRSTRYVLISTRTMDREVWRERFTADLPNVVVQRLQWVFVDLATIHDWVQLEEQ